MIFANTAQSQCSGKICVKLRTAVFMYRVYRYSLPPVQIIW